MQCNTLGCDAMNNATMCQTSEKYVVDMHTGNFEKQTVGEIYIIEEIYCWTNCEWRQ